MIQKWFQWPQRIPKWSQNEPKLAPTWGHGCIKSLKSIRKMNVFQKRAKVTPNDLQVIPKPLQSVPKSTQSEPKWSQSDPILAGKWPPCDPIFVGKWSRSDPKLVQQWLPNRPVDRGSRRSFLANVSDGAKCFSNHPLHNYKWISQAHWVRSAMGQKTPGRNSCFLLGSTCEP